ncbi:hypothetical protein TNCV_3018011 [Trichonephila clavipes]|nr:hypothetical protein TNCV_3018011 [Trichonephila clavipes]
MYKQHAEEQLSQSEKSLRFDSPILCDCDEVITKEKSNGVRSGDTDGGVDITDEMCSMYDVLRICYRWSLRIFYHVLNTAGINASVVNHSVLPEK